LAGTTVQKGHALLETTFMASFIWKRIVTGTRLSLLATKAVPDAVSTLAMLMGSSAQMAVLHSTHVATKIR
jgi:hypothetical protein